ncbi:glycosyltransferase [Cyanobium sp. ATX 6F1]|uniref:glycosyltransferase n=1 Tax=Cyanobium sp. ATX 6F1 TaxID=2823702 RepID=UPI0020CD8EA3|nr:glycosyltransferase [Cyanobium sp. ATX 6F1]MCP9915841.1 glycosyltransferase [Cyanobium sp. ATX 6F1]
MPSPVSKVRGWPWSEQSSAYNNKTNKLLPAIAVIMPSYNQGCYIEESIRSVLLQNYPRLFFAVIDGGSSDETTEVLNRYKPWLSHIRIGPDDGQSAAINEGFDLFLSRYHSASALLGWLNSDDIYLPNALNYVATCFQRRKYSLVYADSVLMNSEGTKISYHLNPLIRDRYLKDGGLLASHATFWSASIHQPLDERYQCAMDYELWLRIVPQSNRRYIPRPIGAVRIHSNAKSYSSRWADSWQSDAALNGILYPWLFSPKPLVDLERKFLESLHKLSSKNRIRKALYELKIASRRWN